jgi:hypothetical protein
VNCVHIEYLARYYTKVIDIGFELLYDFRVNRGPPILNVSLRLEVVHNRLSRDTVRPISLFSNPMSIPYLYIPNNLSSDNWHIYYKDSNSIGFIIFYKGISFIKFLKVELNVRN